MHVSLIFHNPVYSIIIFFKMNIFHIYIRFYSFLTPVNDLTFYVLMRILTEKLNVRNGKPTSRKFLSI